MEVITELWGLQVVGWYHSHPAFAPLPSVIDIANQLMAQVRAVENAICHAALLAAVVVLAAARRSWVWVQACYAPASCCAAWLLRSCLLCTVVLLLHIASCGQLTTTHKTQHTQRNARQPCGCEPYIAAIVSPYDKRLPALASALSWFTVEYDRSRPPAPDKGPLEQVGDGSLSLTASRS